MKKADFAQPFSAMHYAVIAAFGRTPEMSVFTNS
jgi:hypothetical protein